MQQQELNQLPKYLRAHWKQFKWNYRRYQFLARIVMRGTHRHDQEEDVWRAESFCVKTETLLRSFLSLRSTLVIQHAEPQKEAHKPTLFLLSRVVFAQAAWFQAVCDWWKAQSTESCELRAWINIRWAQHRDGGREGGERSRGRLHILIPSPPATAAAAAAAIWGPSSSSVDKTVLSLEEESTRAILRKWRWMRTLKMYFSLGGIVI